MENNKHTILLCRGTGCESSKSPELQAAFEEALQGSDVEIKFTGCHGMCQQGPIVVIEPEDIFYAQVKLKDVPKIVEKHLKEGETVDRLFYKDPATKEAIPTYHEIPFYKRQKRLVLRNCGQINPEEIEDSLAAGSYQGLEKALGMDPVKIVSEVKKSGLRGRGGGGFPTGLKWQFCQDAEGDPKYVLCNADEGDPGAFMDRSVLEGDPHSVLEGMIIAGFAIGAEQGYIYCRAEYPLAIQRLQIAIDQARQQGFLGEDILDSGFDFDIDIFHGAGAFVCGEETALITSIEGNRGMPRSRPPYPANAGLYGKPTLLNNVKTYANIPLIIQNGSGWFADIGTESSTGTAVFALTGKIANSGLIEVPMGITLREIIYDIGGGVLKGKKFKAVQTGGPSGGCLPESFLDTPVDYDSLIEAGSMMGSGGMVVMDEDTCMVDVARYFLDFTEKESCGKCVPCRLGTKEMLDILEDIVHGYGKPGDIDRLEELAKGVKSGSLCGLGQTAPNPVLTTLRYFRDEYEAHIYENRCPAKQCKEFITYHITDTCIGCGLCLRNCPVEAISGEPKERHEIDQDTCIKCGVCYEVCPPKFFSVEIRTGEEQPEKEAA